jgi:outer membrane protein assembly factor BamB
MKASWGKVRIGATAILAVAAFAIMAATASVSHAQLATSPWPMISHDPSHTGLSTVGTSGNNGTLKWALNISSGGISSIDPSPVIGADGTIYVGSIDGNLYAVNPDGTQKWAFGISGAESSPAIGADGTIYIGSGDGNLYAVTDGGQGTVTEKWAFATNGNVPPSPTIGSDGTIYVGSDDLYAVNPNGTLKWKFVVGGVESSAAIGADGTIYAGSDDDNLYAVNPNGTQKWKFTTGGVVYSSPAIGADGTIYVGSEDQSLYALTDGGQGIVTEKWALATGELVQSSPAIGADGTIYVGAGALIAVTDNGTSATQKWSFGSSGEGISSPAIGADGTIYVGTGALYALNPDGTQKWALAGGAGVALSSPSIGADGTVYISSGDGHLYAVGYPPTTISVPASLAFGNSPVGDTVTKNITVKNTGKTNPLFITGVSSNNPAEFAATGATTCPPGGLAPGLSCTIAIRFTPGALAARNATLTLTDNTPTSPQNVALSGTGTVDMTVTPASYAFGSVKAGSKTTKSIAVRNYQTNSVSLSEAFSGPNNGDFSVTGGTCTSTLAPRTFCTLIVTFAPTAVNTESATMTVTDSPDPLGPYTVSFTASATIPESLSAKKLNFGNVYQTGSKTLSITLTNNATTGSITLAGTSIVGANSGDFVVTGGSCTGSLAASSTCTYAVTFTPTTETAESGTLSIGVAEDPNGGPPAVSLVGTGLTPLKVAPVSLAFGTIVGGRSSKNKTVTVTNNGGAAVTITESVGGTNPGDFAVTGGTCTSTLAGSGASCTYTMTFMPSIVGAESATLGVSASGDGASPHNISLSGTGAPSPLPE